MQPRVPNIPRRGQTAAMGEINRSIEKMSIGESGTMVKSVQNNKSRGMGPQTTTMMQNNRRDSNWTVSTEGYGSMRSNTSASRRCSEISQVSCHNLDLIIAPIRYILIFRCQLSLEDKTCNPLGIQSVQEAQGDQVKRVLGCLP